MTDDCDLKVRFFEAPAELTGCFSVIYLAELAVENGGQIEDLLLPEWSNIRIFRGDSPVASLPGSQVDGHARLVATGPTIRATSFRLGSTRMWGVGLFPEGFARLMDLHAGEVANTISDVEQDPRYQDLIPLADAVLSLEPDAEAELAAIFDFFRQRLKDVHHLEEIRRMHTAILCGEISNTGELSEVTGIHPRQLERLAKRYFGFPPKALLRRQRFVRTLSNFVLQQPIQWTEAMDRDYYDQAQFTREFREFMGMTPQQFAAIPHPIQEVFMVERAKVWGAAAQTLDRFR